MTYGSAGVKFDRAFDADVRVNLNVPADVINYELEVIIPGEGASTLLGMISICISPSHGTPVRFDEN
jgi:hypothetical protein